MVAGVKDGERVESAAVGTLVIMEMFCIQTTCINVNVLAVILQHPFLRRYCGKLGKVHMESLCIISYKSMTIYNYLKIKSLALTSVAQRLGHRPTK